MYLRNDEVSVLYYNLSIIDDIDGTLLATVQVFDTGYQFDDEDLFIHRYTYVITGVNELGEGISNSKTFSYQRGKFIANLLQVIFFSSQINNGKHHIQYFELYGR